MKIIRLFFLLGAIVFSVSAFSVGSDVATSRQELERAYLSQIKTICDKLRNDLNGKEGRVWTSFTVLPKGEIRNIRVESSTNSQLDTIAMNVIASLTKMNNTFFEDSIRILYPIDLFEKEDFYVRNSLCSPIIRKLEAPFPAGEFPGGNDAFVNYLYNNLNRSVVAVSSPEPFYIKIDFRIDKNGKATDIKFLGNVGRSDLKSEVKRLMKNMPAWIDADHLSSDNNRFQAVIYLGPNDENLKKTMLRSFYTNYFNIILPEFPGGVKALLNFLSTEIKYPKEAQKKRIYGRVISVVTIDKEGRTIDKSLTKGVHPLLDQEALRVISKLPRFKPGTLDGDPIEMELHIPINFSIPQ